MRFVTFCLSIVLLVPAWARAQTVVVGDEITIRRATGAIKIDGDLSDAAWRDATRVTKWYETQPGDNVEPKVRNVGYVTYDDKFLYAAFEFDDPHPSTLHAPFADHDNISGNATDYGGILVDGRGTGQGGAWFVATPRNVQYDAITDDASGENSSPDFFWDSAAKITATGWTLEIRIPFSSIRYRKGDPQTWRVILYRNYPREFHYQFFTARQPRDGNCFVCHANVLTGLEHLPQGGHLVIAPYTTANDVAKNGGDLGSPLGGGTATGHIGLDAKFLPNADNAFDLTIKPDFSQIESDTAQISTNQRFALFFPERRPFFLEGVDLFATPMNAVYTRTITDPRFGARATGKAQGIRYTVLVADDAGGGSAILPGPTSSSLASLDFGSTVVVARAKHDIGLSFVSVLATDRENHDGLGHNRVAGPDFQLRVGPSNVVSGQALFSTSATPNRPGDASEWTGQSLSGRAAIVKWNHGTTHFDWYAQAGETTSGFRADTGFMPQVGFRQTYGFAGWSVHPRNFPISKIRTFVTLDRQTDMSGRVIGTTMEEGVGLDTKWSGFVQLRAPITQIRTGSGALFTRHTFNFYAQVSPSRFIPQIQMDGGVGQDTDVDNSRPGHGVELNFSLNLRPGNHLELAAIENTRWLNVAAPGSSSEERLFLSRVSRIKSTYNFTAKLYARAIAQYVSTNRNPLLYTSPVDSRSGDFSGSLLVAYKLNWQSVLFLGYGDDRALTQPTNGPGLSPPGRQLAPIDRQVFVKVSYAFQR